MRIAIYARESCDDLNRAPPITTQLEAGQAWATREGHEVVRVYPDNGYSGGNWKRPEFNQLRRDARRHFFGLVWVWDLDRLARDATMFGLLFNDFNAVGVRVFEHRSGSLVDMTTANGRFSNMVMASAAEFYRVQISEKVKRKHEEKKRKGEAWGRHPLPCDLARAVALRAEGKGWRSIAREIGLSASTVRRRLCQNSTIPAPSQKEGGVSTVEESQN